MKHTPLQRKTPLRSRSPRKRARQKHKSKYARRPRGWDYMAWVHTLPCMVIVIGPPVADFSPFAPRCSGPIQADHAGERIAGMGTRSRDRDCIPLCECHHEMVTNYRGMFSERAVRKQWRTKAIATTQEMARAEGVKIPDA